MLSIKTSQDYNLIGHNPSDSNPVILWLITADGQLHTKEIKAPSTHDGWDLFINMPMDKKMAQGRFDTVKKICTIYHFQKFSQQYIKNELKDKFGYDISFREFNSSLYNYASFNWYKIAKDIGLNNMINTSPKMVTFDIYISKQYFPKEKWPDKICNDAMYSWRIKAPYGKRSEAAMKVWEENKEKILSEVNPWIKRISLNVSGGTGMGSVEFAERLSPIQVHPFLKI